MIRADNPDFALRHQVVTFARAHGIKAAARHFGCTRNTVRKWLRRFKALGLDGLKPQSRAPLSCPHKTKPPLEAKVVALRKKTPGFGARRLIEEFDLPLGHDAVQRILRDHRLTRPPKRRQHRRNDLRAIKAAYAPFTRFQMDVKHLTDIPVYWPQMQSLKLPRFQYTIRELSCGAQFLAYSDELSKTYATFAAERFLQHLKHHGLDTTEVLITTDLGSEFDGGTLDCRPEGFHLTIEQRHGAAHRFNPPSCPNANADVESVHHTIEAEFFDAQAFQGRTDFFAKIATYQLWYNVARKNGSRGYQSPLDLLARKNRERTQKISPKIFLLHPIPLESLLPPSGGHDVTRRAGLGRSGLDLGFTQREQELMLCLCRHRATRRRRTDWSRETRLWKVCQYDQPKELPWAIIFRAFSPVNQRASAVQFLAVFAPPRLCVEFQPPVLFAWSASCFSSSAMRASIF
jgi:transposase